MGTPREDALEIFHHALEASRVDAAMKQQVTFRSSVMEVRGHRYPLEQYRRCMLIAIGKAAGTMSAAFLKLSERNADRFEGIVVSPNDEVQQSGNLSYYRGGHPLPNATSMEASERILESLVTLTAEDLVIFLISGGGSALIARSLEQGTTLETIVATHKVLIESGAPIAAINVIRKHLSIAVGGRLAAAAAPAEQLTLLVSDVPESELDALSSGPTMPDRSTLADVDRIMKEYGLDERLPPEAVSYLRSDAAEETPKPEDKIFARSRWIVLLDSSSLEQAAKARAERLGWKACIDRVTDDWPADKAAEYLVARVRALRNEHGRVCLIAAGEVTVKLPRNGAGTGGRNQHFALLCSERIAGDTITVLSCGSDGVDGNSPAAGAIVDGTTVARATAAGCSVYQALETFDSYSLLEKLEDTVKTGPTGNNLRDLRILLAR